MEQFVLHNEEPVSMLLDFLMLTDPTMLFKFTMT
jgi:hypothetical protein